MKIEVDQSESSANYNHSQMHCFIFTVTVLTSHLSFAFYNCFTLLFWIYLEKTLIVLGNEEGFLYSGFCLFLSEPSLCIGHYSFRVFNRCLQHSYTIFIRPQTANNTWKGKTQESSPLRRLLVCLRNLHH